MWWVVSDVVSAGRLHVMMTLPRPFACMILSWVGLALPVHDIT